MNTIERRKMWTSICIAVTLLALFWGFSRYPALINEYLRADQGTLIEREMGSISKDAMMSPGENATDTRQIMSNTINWINENRMGMSFGILFGGVILLLGQNLSTSSRLLKRTKTKGVLNGIFFGAPMGVCTNCAAPIGVAMHRAGASPETIYALVITSPVLNPVGVATLFLLFPLNMAIFRMIAMAILLLVLLPMITAFYKKSVKPVDEYCVVENNDSSQDKSSTESVIVTISKVFLQWVKNVGRLILWVVPIMISVALVMSIFTAYVPFEYFALVDTFQWPWIVAAGVVGVLAPVPMFFDLVIVYMLLALGVSEAIALTLLITLPSVSLFNAIVLGKNISWKISLSLMVTVCCVGILFGLVYLKFPVFDESKAQFTSIEQGVARELSANVTIVPFNKTNIRGGKGGFEKVLLSKVSENYKKQLAYNPLLDFSVFLSTTAGISWSDFNNDGWIDLFSIQERKPKLYMNDGKGNLIDVTEKYLPPIDMVASGVWGDFDNDGYPDLIITRYADFSKGGRFDAEPLSNILLKNMGTRFIDVSKKAGITAKGYSQGAAWGDMDNDGDLDLYIANYGIIKTGGIEAAGNLLPEQYPTTTESIDKSVLMGSYLFNKYRIWDAFPQKDFLYRNNGDGTFTNVIDSSGIGGMSKWAKFQLNKGSNGVTPLEPTTNKNFMGFSFQPIWFDIDNDGDLDLFVSTDFYKSQIFINRGDGTFEKKTDMIKSDIPTTTMGALAFDINNDGYFDIYEACSEENYLWLNNDGQYFSDFMARKKGLDTRNKIGWGVISQDFNNDGVNELVVTNGAFGTLAPWNQGQASKVMVAIQAQNAFYAKQNGGYRNLAPMLRIADVNHSRGIAAADVNNDGFMDMAINNVDEGIALYLNKGTKGNSIEVRLKAKNIVGAKISVLSDNSWQHKMVSAGNSFLSQDSPWIHFGLGQAPKVDEIIITWPNGEKQIIKNIPANHNVIITSPKLSPSSRE